jgi:hypothetical protein
MSNRTKFHALQLPVLTEQNMLWPNEQPSSGVYGTTNVLLLVVVFCR